MKNFITAVFLLTSLAAQSQTASWNGHTYEVIWFPADHVREDDAVFGWWAGGGGRAPEIDASKRGGHVVTITSIEEQTALDALWPGILAHGWQYPNPADRMRLGIQTIEEHIEFVPQGEAIKTYTIYWQTGEVGMFPTLSEDAFIMGTISYKTYPGGTTYVTDYTSGEGNNGVVNYNGWAFYILEIDPPIVPVDTDGDGLPDEEERANRKFVFSTWNDPTQASATTTKTWVEAREWAHGVGGYLPVLTTDEEWYSIRSVMRSLRAQLPLVDARPILPYGEWWDYRKKPDGEHGLDLHPTESEEPGTRLHQVGAPGWWPYVVNRSILDAGTTRRASAPYPGTLYDEFTWMLIEFPLEPLSTDPNNPDTDGDGLSDGQEVDRYGTSPLHADTDRDTYSDNLELQKGSNPLSKDSIPGPDLAPITVLPAIEIQFVVPAGRKYHIQLSSDLVSWTNLGDEQTGTGQPIARFMQAREEASFVRVALARLL